MQERGANPVFRLTTDEEHYVRGIDGYRRVALSIPALSISLSSALLAFEIYYLQHFYQPKPGLLVEDFIVLLPMAAGCLFLVCAAFAIDWVIDSFSDAELRALNLMHSTSEGQDHRDYSARYRGFQARRRLFAGAYFIFVICLATLFFLLISALPIFLKDASANSVARGGMIAGGAYFAVLLALKMMTGNISRRMWQNLLGLGAVFGLGVIWSIASLLRLI
jgi:uncharacterized membrane protein (DUF485 family)